MRDILEESLFRNINRKLNREDIAMLSPLQLAYVGDAVYELFFRMYLLDSNKTVNDLHKETTGYVKAEAQADSIHKLEEILSEEEKQMVKRGRNAKSNTAAKNANLIDYKYATGLECLFGYLYLMEKEERLKELFIKIVEDEN